VPYRRRLLLLALAGLSLQAIAGSTSDSSKPLKASIAADLDGDGKVDRVSLEVVKHQVILDVAMAGKKTSTYAFSEQEFGCSPVKWSEGCVGKQVRMTVVKIDAEFRRDFAFMFEIETTHLSSRSGAHAVMIPLSETDPIWVYWDPATKGVDWARL
jgi:hypothetical protein